MSSSTFGTSAAITAGALVTVRLLIQKDADEWQRRRGSGGRVSVGIAAVKTGRMWPRQLGG